MGEGKEEFLNNALRWIYIYNLKKGTLRKTYERKWTLRKIEIPPPKHERSYSHLPLIILEKNNSKCTVQQKPK